MELIISTTAQSGHLLALLIDSQGRTIRTLGDTDSKKVLLMSGERYTLQWTIWSPHAASYSVEASAEPMTPGYPIQFSLDFNEAKKTSGIEIIQA
jgi:hypothetical protein